MNLREWLRHNYEFSFMDTENGALGLRKKATGASIAFGGGKAAQAPYKRLTEILPELIQQARVNGIEGGRHAIIQACHSLGFDHQQKTLEDRRLNHPQRH